VQAGWFYCNSRSVCGLCNYALSAERRDSPHWHYLEAVSLATCPQHPEMAVFTHRSMQLMPEYNSECLPRPTIGFTVEDAMGSGVYRQILARQQSTLSIAGCSKQTH